MSDDDIRAAEELAHEIRDTVLLMCAGRGQGYAGQGLALADLLAILFTQKIREDNRGARRDRIVLSTGHSAVALFAALGSVGEYELGELVTYGQDGSRIEESPLEGTPGFEITGGALGQGLSQAVGLALGERMLDRDTTIYCVISDGELDEGQIWEAAMAAGHYRLGNLVVIVDSNNMQADGAPSEVMTIEPITDKWQAFGFTTARVSGHDLAVLSSVIPAGGAVPMNAPPTAIILDTVPGKGVPSFERYQKVHYVRASAQVWDHARAELRAQRGVDDQPVLTLTD